jgi:putative FmdB family regulatory protein
LPIYEYRCRNGHIFEVLQSMSDEPVTKCEVCGAPVERVFHPVALHFKGSGFYSTDYGRGSRKATSKDGESGGSGDGSGPTEKPTAKTDAKTSDSKSDS